jgi:hypothetical protein
MTLERNPPKEPSPMRVTEYCTQLPKGWVATYLKPRDTRSTSILPQMRGGFFTAITKGFRSETGMNTYNR